MIPPKGVKFCQNCAKPTDPLADVCLVCGAKLARAEATPATSGGKSKTASILLAVFLGFWTWLYTYKRNAWKFWTAIGVAVVNVILTVVTLGLWVFVGWIVWVGLWVWPIVDVATKGEDWYRSY